MTLNRASEIAACWREIGKTNQLYSLSRAAVILDDRVKDLEGAFSAQRACLKAALNQLKIRTQELKECRAEIDHLSEAIAGVGNTFEYQRRHRKWALKEVRMMLATWRYCEIDCQHNYLRAIKAEADKQKLIGVLEITARQNCLYANTPGECKGDTKEPCYICKAWNVIKEVDQTEEKL